MVLLLDVNDIVKIVNSEGILEFFRNYISELEDAFRRWEEFEKKPRQTFYFENGVLETMPIADKNFYSVKIVNGHPPNPKYGKLTVVAIGLLFEVKYGYPLLITEGTILTAIRTGGTTGLATKYLARKDSESVGIIGTGSQSEFQILGVLSVMDNIKTIYFYDIDPKAMEKFERNMKNFKLNLIKCKGAEEVVRNSDILITATAGKGKRKIVLNEWINEGIHINAIGGDAPGKTELDPEILRRAKVVVEYLPQTIIEGEIQNVGEKAVYAELWEIVSGKKPGRVNDKEITVFDSVGFALEDWVMYNYIYKLAKKHNIGKEIDIIPEVKDPKDLFSILLSKNL